MGRDARRGDGSAKRHRIRWQFTLYRHTIPPVPSYPQITIRTGDVTEEVNERADALVPSIAEELSKFGVRVSRSSVLRAALLEGLTVLERRYGLLDEEDEAEEEGG